MTTNSLCAASSSHDYLLQQKDSATLPLESHFSFLFFTFHATFTFRVCVSWRFPGVSTQALDREGSLYVFPIDLCWENLWNVSSAYTSQSCKNCSALYFGAKWPTVHILANSASVLTGIDNLLASFGAGITATTCRSAKSTDSPDSIILVQYY